MKVDETYLANHPNWEKDFDQLAGKAYEAIPVQNSKETEGSFLIRAHLAEDEGERTVRRFLYTLLDKYYQKDAEIYLFLHRKDGFSQQVLGGDT